MEIVRKIRSSCRFDEIEKGQCFVTDTDIDGVYMRMHVGNAAIDLTTGQTYTFDLDSMVTPINARVEIE